MSVRDVLKAVAYGAAIGGATYLGKKGVLAVTAGTQKQASPKGEPVVEEGQLTHTHRILRDRGMYN
jgi:hypothetical protein